MKYAYESSRVRNRTLTIRLTEDEYTRVKSACARQGGRSVSEFMRNAALDLAESGALVDGSAQTHFANVEKKLAELGSHVGRLSEMLAVRAAQEEQ